MNLFKRQFFKERLKLISTLVSSCLLERFLSVIICRINYVLEGVNILSIDFFFSIKHLTLLIYFSISNILLESLLRPQ